MKKTGIIAGGIVVVPFLGGKLMKKIPFYKIRKVQATAIIIFAIIFELVFAIIYRCIINPELPFPEILYYTSQIISSIFVISGVVIAVWQYYLSSKSAKTDLEIQQVQRAIDLSEYYKDNILNYYPAIKYIFKETGIAKIIEKVRLNDIKTFDIIELNRLFTKEDIDELKKIQNSKEFFETAVTANMIYNLNDKLAVTTLINKDNSAVITYVSSLVDNLLNNMEFFSLHFSHKTADETVIYQSLHQTYLEIVQYMYYDIAVSNTDPTNKYYTNIIWLFLEWRNELNRKNDEQETQLKTFQSSGTIIGDINKV